MNSAASALVAHQGGWDEALLIAGPILAIVGLLMIAKRRVEAAVLEQGMSESEAATAPATDAEAGPETHPTAEATSTDADSAPDNTVTFDR